MDHPNPWIGFGTIRFPARDQSPSTNSCKKSLSIARNSGSPEATPEKSVNKGLNRPGSLSSIGNTDNTHYLLRATPLFRLIPQVVLVFLAVLAADSSASLVLEHPDQFSLEIQENTEATSNSAPRSDSTVEAQDPRPDLIGGPGGVADSSEGFHSGGSNFPPGDQSPHPEMVPTLSSSRDLGEFCVAIPPSPIDTLLRPPQSASSLISC